MNKLTDILLKERMWVIGEDERGYQLDAEPDRDVLEFYMYLHRNQDNRVDRKVLYGLTHESIIVSAVDFTYAEGSTRMNKATLDIREYPFAELVVVNRVYGVEIERPGQIYPSIKVSLHFSVNSGLDALPILPPDNGEPGEVKEYVTFCRTLLKLK